ncbi:hypothetical protein [Sphaerisporangium rufum]|nr:hypothetical protein [Sphaerisporangium rufum]
MTRVILISLGLAILIVALVVGGRALLRGRESPGPFSQAAAEQALHQGVAPDLIYAVEVKGFAIQNMSVGAIGDEGFGALYASNDGRTVQLRIDRGAMTDATCAGTPVTGTGPGAPVRCERDEAGWYRVSGEQHEYVAAHGDHLIRLAGRLQDVDRAILKAAITGARQVTVTSSTGTSPGTGPVPRGDLPTTGDGAPIQNNGPGG